MQQLWKCWWLIVNRDKFRRGRDLTLSENRDFKEEALLILKKEKAGDLLITAIKKTEKSKHILVAACWESEINFSNNLPFFVELATHTDYLVALEAMTVISNMEGPFDTNQVNEALLKLRNYLTTSASERKVLINDLIFTLEGFL